MVRICNSLGNSLGCGDNMEAHVSCGSFAPREKLSVGTTEVVSTAVDFSGGTRSRSF